MLSSPELKKLVVYGGFRCEKPPPCAVGQTLDEKAVVALIQEYVLIKGSPVAIRGIFSDVFQFSPDIRNGWNYLWHANRRTREHVHHYEVFCLKASPSQPGMYTCVACCRSPQFQLSSSKRANQKAAPKPKRLKTTLAAATTIAANSTSVMSANEAPDTQQTLQIAHNKSVRQSATAMPEQPVGSESAVAQSKSEAQERTLNNQARTVDSVVRVMSAVCAAFDRITLEKEMMEKFMLAFSLDDDEEAKPMPEDLRTLIATVTDTPDMATKLMREVAQLLCA